MYTVGIDMTTISRIEKSLSKKGFAQFVYGNRELELFYGEKPKFSSLAANFSAKEALGKALGTGVRNFELSEVQVLRTEQGKPYFVFSGKALKIMEDKGYTAEISLSHEGDFAIAMVILQSPI